MKKTGIFPHCCYCLRISLIRLTALLLPSQTTFPTFNPERALICICMLLITSYISVDIVLDQSGLVLFFRGWGGGGVYCRFIIYEVIQNGCLPS